MVNMMHVVCNALMLVTASSLKDGWHHLRLLSKKCSAQSMLSAVFIAHLLGVRVLTKRGSAMSPAARKAELPDIPCCTLRRQVMADILHVVHSAFALEAARYLKGRGSAVSPAPAAKAEPAEDPEDGELPPAPAPAPEPVSRKRKHSPIVWNEGGKSAHCVHYHTVGQGSLTCSQTSEPFFLQFAFVHLLLLPGICSMPCSAQVHIACCMSLQLS